MEPDVVGEFHAVTDNQSRDRLEGLPSVGIRDDGNASTMNDQNLPGEGKKKRLAQESIAISHGPNTELDQAVMLGEPETLHEAP